MPDYVRRREGRSWSQKDYSTRVYKIAAWTPLAVDIPHEPNCFLSQGQTSERTVEIESHEIAIDKSTGGLGKFIAIDGRGQLAILTFAVSPLGFFTYVTP